MAALEDGKPYYAVIWCSGTLRRCSIDLRNHNKKDGGTMTPSRSGDEPKKRRPLGKPEKGQVRQKPRRPTEGNASIRIAHRAYEIYMERICRGPLDDWLEAEREMLSHEPPG
jgi:hypothetical protein